MRQGQLYTRRVLLTGLLLALNDSTIVDDLELLFNKTVNWDVLCHLWQSAVGDLLGAIACMADYGEGFHEAIWFTHNSGSPPLLLASASQRRCTPGECLRGTWPSLLSVRVEA
jgi:hypothetical protein